MTGQPSEGELKERRVKQVIIIRKDLKMRRGKEVAQGAHASMMFMTTRLAKWAPEGYGPPDALGYRTAGDFTLPEMLWMSGSFRKIAVQADSEEELMEAVSKAKDAGLAAHVVTDSGLTEFAGVPTVTAAAIGPDYDDRIDPVTGCLRLY